MHLSLLIPLTGAAMNALCIFIIRLLDKDFIEVYKKTLKKITALHILCMAEMVSILGTVVPFLVIIIAMIWFLFFSSKREKEELTRVEREAAKTKLRIDVYHRLRYVESDHVVFDPITGREVPAERACINKLIEALADESNNVS